MLFVIFEVVTKAAKMLGIKKIYKNYKKRQKNLLKGHYTLLMVV